MPRLPVLVLSIVTLSWINISGPRSTGAQQPPSVEAPALLRFPEANSRPTWHSVHNLSEAHRMSRGAGVKVGILDHSFGFSRQDGLYAGGQNFQTGEWGESFDTVEHHGFWMACALKEVAPEAEVYALGTYSSDEGAKVEAMVRAIDWAIEHDLDVLTYSAARFSPGVRPQLDEAVERAHAAGIVTTFIHYPHPDNLLPTWIGPRSGDDEREPDVNILQYDYSVIFTARYVEWLGKGAESGYRPYLSISSTSPVTAGIVALLRAVRPGLDPGDCRRILMETGRPFTLEGMTGVRTVDAAAALQRATLDPEGQFRLFYPLLGRPWTGHFVSEHPEEAAWNHIVRWEPILEGQSFRFHKEVPEHDFHQEVTYAWSTREERFVFQALTDRGQLSNGTMRFEEGMLVLEGVNHYETPVREFRQTFRLRPDGVLEDRFYRREGDRWVQGHLIEYRR